MSLMNFTKKQVRGRLEANQKTMADKTKKQPRNVPGPFYVDDSCIDCDICRENAASFFRRDDELGYSYVWKQPETETEIALAIEARDGCPSDSIGSDGVK